MEICANGKRETLWLRAEALSENGVVHFEREVSPKGSCVRAGSPLGGTVEERLDQESTNKPLMGSPRLATERWNLKWATRNGPLSLLSLALSLPDPWLQATEGEAFHGFPTLMFRPCHQPKSSGARLQWTEPSGAMSRVSPYSLQLPQMLSHSEGKTEQHTGRQETELRTGGGGVGRVSGHCSHERPQLTQSQDAQGWGGGSGGKGTCLPDGLSLILWPI